MFGKRNKSADKTGLLLSGGGARAAYQVGVLKAISELCPNQPDNPFHIIAGTSAGSINAVALAAHEGDFQEAVDRIHNVWSNFELNHVFKSDARCLFGRILRWFGSRILPFGLGGITPPSMLDNTPLRELLDKHIDFDGITRQIEAKKLGALSLNTSSYTSGESITFFESGHKIDEWQRAYRAGLEQKISLDMLMASSSIPVLFPPVKINGEYYGDGSMRQTSPLSSLVHLQAKKIFIIGVRKRDVDGHVIMTETAAYPSMARIAGFVMDTLFLNSLDADLERLRRINEISEKIPAKHRKYNRIEHFIVSPSEDLSEIAEELFDTLPITFRWALKLLGINKGGSRKFVSYLMFNKAFCKRLIDLGYKDAMVRQSEIMEFLEIQC
ncbi:MAG: patatin-like phospholipase family protein [Arenicella sp.]